MNNHLKVIYNFNENNGFRKFEFENLTIVSPDFKAKQIPFKNHTNSKKFMNLNSNF